MNVGVIEAAAGSMLWKFDMVEQTKRHGCNNSDRNISGLSFLMLFRTVVLGISSIIDRPLVAPDILRVDVRTIRNGA